MVQPGNLIPIGQPLLDVNLRFKQSTQRKKTWQVDQRDNLRPLNYRGRFMEGISSKSKEKDFFWRQARLWRDGRTEMATQLHAKDMITIESLLEDPSQGTAMAAPEPDENLFHGARKVEQIGKDGCEKLLMSMVNDLQMTARSAVFIVDLNMGVGQMFEAFANLKSTWNMPVFYIGCTDDCQTSEWFGVQKTVSCLELF